jgi:hypothetical protein
MGINGELWNKLVDGSHGDTQELLESFAIACHENAGIAVHICATKKGADGSTKTSMQVVQSYPSRLGILIHPFLGSPALAILLIKNFKSTSQHWRQNGDVSYSR